MANLEGVAACRSYDRYQKWPARVSGAVAEHLLCLAGPPPRTCLFLGAATGSNDVFPFARRADPSDRILASDVSPGFVEALGRRARAEGATNVSARRIDITTDLEDLPRFTLVTLFFVIHRLAEWRPVVPELARRLAPGGVFVISEFVGPGGLIFLSNERGGSGTDPVSRLIRRYFELLPGRFDPPLKSTTISPVLAGLSRLLVPSGHRDFHWPQRITVREAYRRIAEKAYAPYFSVPAPDAILERLRHDFAREMDRRVESTETIRVYAFRAPGR